MLRMEFCQEQYEGLVFKNACVLQIALFKIFRRAVRVQFISDIVYNRIRFRCAENCTPQGLFRWYVMVCYRTPTAEKTRPDVFIWTGSSIYTELKAFVESNLNILILNLFVQLRGYCNRNLKLACFLCYLYKIIYTFSKNNACISRKIVQGTQKCHWNFSRSSAFKVMDQNSQNNVWINYWRTAWPT